MGFVRYIIATLCAMVVGYAVELSAQSLSESTTWHWEGGTIVVDVPERADDQEHVVGLVVEPIENLCVGFVGLGMRGPWAVMRFAHIPGVEVVALCDYERERAEACQRFLYETSMMPADIYHGATGYEALCEREDIDLVYIATDWNHHYPVAKYAMEHGKHVAIEVPSAMNLEQCWTLIDLAESKRLHCFILENCCYDYYELTALNMAQQGLFGEIVRAEGAYIHTLDIYWDSYWHDPNDNDTAELNWRLKYNMENRGDLYATHGLGPVAQCMNIHRGDRFTTLVAMDTESFVGRELVESRTGEECAHFRNGDHTTTLMRTAQGKVVEIQHNVMTPQPYNRLFKLMGTKGYATKYPTPEFALSADGLKSAGVPQMDNLNAHSFVTAEQRAMLMEVYRHPLIEQFGELGREMGHGGMDYIMDARLVYCLQNGLPLDMDVYDMAEWCCLAELGSLSMDNNCASVAFPDFTRGHWSDVNGYRHAYSKTEAATAAKAMAYTLAQREVTAEMELWNLYFAVAEARKKGDVKAETKAQKRLDAAKVAARKTIADRVN